MTLFDTQTLAHLKKLCCIDCTPEEDADILQNLPRILEYVELLNEIDTSQVKPCSYVLDGMAKHRLRPDETGDLISREIFLRNAPESLGGMIRTPPILSSDG